MEVRRVSQEDFPEQVGRVYAASWKAAYKGIVPQAYLDRLTGKEWEKGHPGAEMLVLIDDNVIIGVSSVCPARDEGMEGWGEIVSMYLLPAYFGQGLGSLLMEAAIDELKNKGFTKIYLWVLRENIQARRFYEKHGFAAVDEFASICIEGKELTEIRYILNIPEKQ